VRIQTRPVWFLFLSENGKTGIGECAPLAGLSAETPEQVEKMLDEICKKPEHFIENPELTKNISSVQFAFETAWLDFKNGGTQQLFPSAFTEGKKGIPINGLIWMGEEKFMQQQIQEKLDAGFRCIKLKIGGIDFEKELELLKNIREEFDEDKIILRLDANGAFRPEEALEKLHRLSQFKSIPLNNPSLLESGMKWRELF
jgi:L-alanine-DL-glutamate epimerase-like enolase superfamily enzyme